MSSASLISVCSCGAPQNWMPMIIAGRISAVRCVWMTASCAPYCLQMQLSTTKPPPRAPLAVTYGGVGARRAASERSGRTDNSRLLVLALEVRRVPHLFGVLEQKAQLRVYMKSCLYICGVLAVLTRAKAQYRNR